MIIILPLETLLKLLQTSLLFMSQIAIFPLVEGVIGKSSSKSLVRCYGKYQFLIEAWFHDERLAFYSPNCNKFEVFLENTSRKLISMLDQASWSEI